MNEQTPTTAKLTFGVLIITLLAIYKDIHRTLIIDGNE